MRASSWKQISTGLPGGRSAKRAFSVAARFLELRHDALVPRRMAGTRADATEAEPVQDLAPRALAPDHADALGEGASDRSCAKARRRARPDPVWSRRGRPVRPDRARFGKRRRGWEPPAMGGTT